MSKKLITKWIGDDQVTDAKILLGNATWLRARNFANSANVNLLGLDVNDTLISYGDFVPRSGIDTATGVFVDNSTLTPSSTDIYLTQDPGYSGQDGFGSTRVASFYNSPLPGNVQSIDIYLDDIGTNTGNLNIRIYDDSSGTPGTLLGSSDTVLRSSITASGFYTFNFSSPVTMVGGNNYWFSIEGDSAYNTAQSTLGIVRRGANYGTWPVKWFNGSSWVAPTDTTSSIIFTISGDQNTTVLNDLGQVSAPWNHLYVNLINDLNFPTMDGTPGQAIVTDGAGNLSFGTVTTPPSGAAGSIQFTNGTAFASDNANLFWNDSTNKMGIRTNAPVGALDVEIGGSGQGVYFLTGHTGGDTGLAFESGANIQGTNGALSGAVDLTLQPGGANVVLSNATSKFRISSGSAPITIDSDHTIGFNSSMQHDNVGGMISSGVLTLTTADAAGSQPIYIQSGPNNTNTGTPTGLVSLRSGAPNAANGFHSGAVYIGSGDSGPNGNSGDTFILVGGSSNARGKIRLQDGSEGTAGYIWTSTDTTGAGHWAVNSVSTGTANTLAAYNSSGNLGAFGPSYTASTNLLDFSRTTSGGGRLQFGKTIAGGGAIAASAEGSFAFGQTSLNGAAEILAQGIGSMAFGAANSTAQIHASGQGAFAGGLAAGGGPINTITASGAGSFSFGRFNGGSVPHTASGAASFNTGEANTTSGDDAFTSGMGHLNGSYAAGVFGRWSDLTGATATSWVTTDPLFVVGIGASAGSRANAFKIQKDGKLFILDPSLSGASVGYTWTLQNTATGEGAWVAAAGGGGTQRVEYRTISSGEATANALTLANTPTSPTKVLADIFSGGGPMEYSVEFTVTGTTFDWSGGPYAGVFAAGDRLRIVYWS